MFTSHVFPSMIHLWFMCSSCQESFLDHEIKVDCNHFRSQLKISAKVGSWMVHGSTAYTTKTLSRRVSLEHRECGSELRHAETQNMQSRNKSQMDEFYVVRKPRKVAFRLSKPRFYTASDSQTVEAKNVQILRTKILRKQNIKTSGNEQQKAKLRTLQSCEHVYQKLSSALPCLAFFGNYRHKVKTYMIMKRDKYQNLLFENNR